MTTPQHAGAAASALPRWSVPGVVCVSHGFLPDYERGFCNGLAANGLHVTLLGSDRTDFSRLDRLVHTINIRRSQDEGRPRWKKALNLLRYNLSLLGHTVTRRGAVFHVMGSIEPPVWYGIALGMWLRLMCRQYILTVHNLLPHDRHTACNRWAFRSAYRWPTRLVVHTERMKRELTERFGVAPDKVTVMQHGLEPVLGNLHAEATTNMPPKLLVFGRMAPYKGTDVLLEALHRISFDFRLTIAGPPSDAAFRLRLRAMARALSLVNRIQWRDEFLTESDMARLFNEADLVVLPYRHIDQSGVLFQALRFGVPVVASRVGEFEACVTHDVGELARPGNVDDLVAALEAWAARRHTMSRSRIQELAKSCAWAGTVNVLRSVYA